MDLEALKNSDEYIDRAKAAKLGYGLEELINDDNWIVRREVAKKGYMPEVLINDENLWVRLAAEKVLEDGVNVEV